MVSRKSCLRKIPVKTRLGTFLLEMSSRGLYTVRFPKRGQADFFMKCKKIGLSPLLRRFRKARLDLTGYTPFQKKVYQVLRNVPAGKVITYGRLAGIAGHPKAARAVGTAMKANRLPVVIPCHRVVPAGGGIGQYSAGARWKKLLLAYEGYRKNVPRATFHGPRKS